MAAHMPKMSNRAQVPVNDIDRSAALRALARNWPELEKTSPKYLAFLDALADLHRLFGAESFELRYNLRLPKGRIEELQRQLLRNEINEADFRARAKADANRPIDLEMLTTFYDGYQNYVETYSRVLQEIARLANPANGLNWRAQEKTIDKQIDVLRGKLPLWRGNLTTVFDFLDEMRVTS